MTRCPTLVIAGTHSGAGKTSFTLALARALARRGRKTQTFKVGPDFLDPTYLALASCRPCYNLDGWMAGHDHCRRLFARTTTDADCALVEGVMGLFDGADAQSDEGSTAEIARLLDAPVILVVNVHGMGRSFAALVKGYTTFRPDLRFTGVVANHCGSERHAALLSDSLQAAGLPPLLGAIPRGAFPELVSRHLGLVTADRGQLPESLLDALADALERNLSLETLFPKMLTRTTKSTAPIDPGERCDAPDSRKMTLFPELHHLADFALASHGTPPSTSITRTCSTPFRRRAARSFFSLLLTIAACREGSPVSTSGEAIPNSTQDALQKTGRCSPRSALTRPLDGPSMPNVVASCTFPGGLRRTAAFIPLPASSPPGRACSLRGRRSATRRSP
jgi:dethiobiotin synthetase